MKLKKKLYLTGFLLVLTFVAKLVAVNCFSNDGAKLYSLENKKQVLLRENLRLENELASFCSLAKLEKEAKELGLVKAGQVSFVAAPQVASR